VSLEIEPPFICLLTNTDELFGMQKSMKKIAWVPCKEDLIDIEDIAKRQRRLFPDAADVGLWIKDENEQWLVELRRATKNLTKCHGSRIYKGPRLSTVNIFVPFEWDEGFIAGETVEIIRQSFKGKPAMIINIGRAHLKKNEAVMRYGLKMASYTERQVSKVASRWLQANPQFSLCIACGDHRY